MAITMGLADAKNNFSRVTAEVNRTGRPVTIMKNNKPWVTINPVGVQNDSARSDIDIDIAIDFKDEYPDDSEELAR